MNPGLDQILTAEECARWMRMEKRKLAIRSKGRKAVIPSIKLSETKRLYHPRMVLAKLAKDAGVDPEVIAAAFNGIEEKRKANV